MASGKLASHHFISYDLCVCGVSEGLVHNNVLSKELVIVAQTVLKMEAHMAVIPPCSYQYHWQY